MPGTASRTEVLRARLAPGAMPGNGETVRLVADLLDEVKRGRESRRQRYGADRFLS